MTAKILIVDDEPLVRLSLKSFLEDRGVCAMAAESGEAALDVLKGTEIKVVIADMRLPGMEGNTFILKAYEICPSLKFLIYTGSTNYALPPALVKLGVSNNDVFRKPLNDMNIICETIQRYIHGDQ